MFGLSPAGRVLFVAIVAGSALVALWPAAPALSLCRFLVAPAIVTYLVVMAVILARLAFRLAARLAWHRRDARRREKLLDLWDVRPGRR